MVNIINNNKSSPTKSNISPICSSSINSENKLAKIISTDTTSHINTLSNTTTIHNNFTSCTGSVGVGDSDNTKNQNKMLLNNTTTSSLNETNSLSLVIKRKQTELTTATATLNINENDDKETLTSTTKFTTITKTNLIVNSTQSSLSSSSSYSSVTSSPSSSQTSFNQNENSKPSSAALFNENLLKFNQQVHTSNNIALNKLMPLNNTPSNLNILAATATAVNNSMPFKSALRAKKVIK